MGQNALLIYLLMSLGASVVFFFLVREVTIWYFKIDKTINVLEKIDKRLSNLNKHFNVTEPDESQNTDVEVWP